MELMPKEYRNHSNSGGGATIISALPKISAAGTSLWQAAIIVSFAAFILSLAGWIGLYVYGGILKDKLAETKTTFSGVFTRQDMELFGETQILSQSAGIVQELLGNHVYSSELLAAISSSTMPNVRWKGLAITIKDRKISMDGYARNYTTLAKQIIALEKGGLKDIKVSGITLDREGGVNFSIDCSFDPKLISKK